MTVRDLATRNAVRVRPLVRVILIKKDRVLGDGIVVHDAAALVDRFLFITQQLTVRAIGEIVTAGVIHAFLRAGDALAYDLAVIAQRLPVVRPIKIAAAVLIGKSGPFLLIDNFPGVRIEPISGAFL